MKTKTLFYIFLSLSILAISCSKGPDSLNDDLSIKQSDEQLAKKVENFINLAHDAKEGKILKNDEKMPIEEAVDYIESSFNYEYCFPQAGYEKFVEIKTDIKIPILGIEEKVFLVDALTAYNNAISVTRSKYIDITEITKRLFAVCVKNKGVDSTGDTLNVEIKGIIAIGNRPVITTNENRGYWWTNNGGSCEGEPPIFNRGAPEVITDAVNFILNPGPPPGYRVWFDNYSPANPYEEIPTELYLNNNGIQGDNLCDYYIYKAVGSIENLPDYVKCLSIQNGEDELNYYKHSALDVVDTVIVHDGGGRDYLSIVITAHENNAPKYLYHRYDISVADRHLTQVSILYPINIED